MAFQGAIDQQCGWSRLQTAERVHYLRYQVLGLLMQLNLGKIPARSRLQKGSQYRMQLPIERPGYGRAFLARAQPATTAPEVS